jgi:tRNA modification GTPase
LPGDVLLAVDRTLCDVVAGMERELGGSRMAERLRDGFEVALVGRPNVGKSTLLNALAGRDAALTSETAGTTRDVIEVRMDLGGLPLTLLDMAGLREPEERVEALGIGRARTRAGRADLRVFLVDDPADVGGLGVPRLAGDVVALAKADLRTGADGAAVSGLTGAGIDTLLGEIERALHDRVATASSVAHARQRQSIERGSEAVRAARDELRRVDTRTELVAEELRTALRAVDFLVGRVDVEAVLDVIFQNFCLGK